MSFDKFDKKVPFLEAFKKKVCNIGLSCDAVNIDRQTYYNWREGDKIFDQACRDVEEGLIDLAETQLYKNLRSGNQKAVEFYLKNRARDRWSDRQDHHLEGGIDVLVRYAGEKKVDKD